MLNWGGGKTERWKNDECGIIHHKCLFLNWGGGKTEKLNKWHRDKCPKSGVEGGSTIRKS